MTKEQMIEEIREKVILANNPECKTYEEALKVERRSGECYFEIDDGILSVATHDQLMALKYGLHDVFDVMINQLEYADEESEYDEDERTGIYCRSMTDGIDTHEVLKYINRVRGYIINDGRGKISRVIGLPLTLERILVALAKDFKQEFAMCGDFKCRVFWQDNVQEIFHWQPNKTLEEQSEETIKAIYDILCV